MSVKTEFRNFNKYRAFAFMALNDFNKEHDEPLEDIISDGKFERLVWSLTEALEKIGGYNYRLYVNYIRNFIADWLDEN